MPLERAVCLDAGLSLFSPTHRSSGRWFANIGGGVVGRLDTTLEINMGIFAKSIEVGVFGVLHGKGQSGIWERSLDLPCLGNNFLVRVWGTREGPTQSQYDAFRELINNAEKIKVAATVLIVEFLSSCEMLPVSELKNSKFWDFLTPSFIEIHKNHKYCVGEGRIGTNAISVGYSVPWDDDHLLQIGILNGAVDKIYSE